jgi:hypothetical protein
MKFQPANLRKLDGALPAHLRNDQAMTFILVQSSGEVRYAHSRIDKDRLVAAYDEGADCLMLAWTGQYKTDVFELTRAELERRYL